LLVGCLLRNIKVYENVVFIPITSGESGNFSVFTGANGVGKSSVLESMNHFFYQNKWVVNSKAKKEDAYIAPLFVIKKNEFESEISNELLDLVSNYFWDIDDKANPGIARLDGVKKLLAYKESLKNIYNKNEYYLFLVSLRYPNDTFNFATFHNDLKENIESNDKVFSELEGLYKSICEHYSFVYIPVELSIKNILKLEAFELQELMDRDVLNEIDNVLTKRIEVPREALGRKLGRKNVGFTALTHINEKLDDFIKEINTSIQNISESYSFLTERGKKRNLSAQDIRDRILDEYFSVRSLRKDGKPIEELSSGEQRIALFDIAYSLLGQGKRTKKNLILAIDEPEASMHMSQCYRQFARLAEISKRFGHQVLVTTHWYGFLPVLDFGYINHIERSKKVEISQHPLKSVTSEQKILPDDISLKSIFDLVSAVIGMMRSEEANWLVCEGVDDQIYLEHFLKGKIDNLYILPVGGIDNVIKIYNYLYVPLSERFEKKEITGKVVCITDTDIRPVNTDNYGGVRKMLELVRLDKRGEKVSFLKLNPNSERNITVIEDVLDAKVFYAACSKIINECERDDIKQLFDKVELCELSVYTGFSNNLESFKSSCAELYERKTELIDFLSDNTVKYKLAATYIKESKRLEREQLGWVEDLVDLFR